MKYKLIDLIEAANTGADAIKKAPILQEKTNLRCLRIGDVSQKRTFNEWGYTKTSCEDYKRYKLHVGDIVVARTGNTIGVNQYIDCEIEAVYNNGLIRIKVNKEMILPKYFYYIVRGKSCQDYILAPGRYVGIEQEEDDGEPFEEKMQRLTSELSEMFRESIELQEEIRKRLGAIGYDI